MKDQRSFIITVFALILITVAIIVVSIWGYQVYINNKNTDTLSVQNANASQNIQTSRIPISNAPAQQDETHSVDSTATLAQKLDELNRLQMEIKSIIDKRAEDSALQKIEQLEANIFELESKNNRIEAENKKLSKMVRELAAIKKERSVLQKKKNTAFTKNETPTGNNESEVSVNSLNFFTTETSGSDDPSAKQLKGSFVIKANNVSNGELNIVILKPDGKILMNSPWESGVFETSSGKKIYSTKLHFDHTGQRLSFNIDVNDTPTGIYTIQVYYNGKVIATLRKTLG